MSSLITLNDFLLFFGEYEKIARTEQRLLFRSIRRIIFLQLLNQKKFRRDIATEINFQRKIFLRIDKDAPRPIIRLVADLMIAEATTRAERRVEKINPYVLEKIIIDARISILKKFVAFSDIDARNFREIGRRFEKLRDRVISRQTKKGWGIGLGVSSALIAGAVAFYKSSSDKRDEK